MSNSEIESPDALADLLREAARGPRKPERSEWFRFGGGCLEVLSDHDSLFAELETVYGDCAVAPPAPGTPRLRCQARALHGSPFLWLSFDGPRFSDPIEVARSPYRFLRRQRYAEVPASLAGWRRLVNAEDATRLLIASDGKTTLVNLDEAPPEFAVDCIVGVAQSCQTDVLTLHGASVGVGGAGALLVAATGGGKSTLALTLAWRGHAFLGDDVAVVRPAGPEILPFPKSAGLREGPLLRLLGERVRASRHALAASRHGQTRILVRVSDLFPDSVSGPLPLRFAFFLDGLADRASIAPYRPQLADLKRLQSIVNDSTPGWGMTPGRDLMNYLSAVDLFSRLRCYLLQLGPPEESARLIEAAMEGSCS